MTDEPIQPWDSDHTALVHVLWAAKRGGLTISDSDALAAHIMQSRWMRAVKLHARDRTPKRTVSGDDIPEAAE